jgi:serine protease Do
MTRPLRWLVVPLCALSLNTLCRSPVAAQSVAGSLPEPEIKTAVDRVKPSLVRIEVVISEFMQGRESKRPGAGSGTIISADGHVLTNHHVAGKARRIVCTLATKEELSADLVASDPLSDISVLKLRAAAGRRFPVATFGDSSALRVGDPVLAMGSPLALSQSVTRGIVSNTEMILPRLFWPFDRLIQDGEDVGSLVQWIGHDAPIYPGNSGGPLVNLRGEIVGINEMGVGLGGAVPGNLARNVARDLVEVGRVRRSWSGLEVQPLLKASGRTSGALVGGVLDGSPAARAGFHPGDILIRLAGQPVTVRFSEELPLFNQFAFSLPTGKPVEASVLRDAKELTLTIEPRPWESAEARPRELRRWGLSLSDLTAHASREMDRASREGVLVEGVRPGGPAAEARPGLAPRDVILEVDGVAVKSLDDLEQRAGRISKPGTDSSSAERTSVLVTFEREKARYVTLLQVGPAEADVLGTEARKAWLPVGTQVLSRELGEKLGLGDRAGVRITRVHGGSTAERAGLKVGDLIVSLDGEPLPSGTHDDAELVAALIRQRAIGSSVRLGIVRDRKESTIEVGLVAAPPTGGEMPRYRDEHFEFAARDLSAADAALYSWARDGVGVENVAEGGWAALGRLAEGDILLSVNAKPVPNVEALGAIMRSVAESRPSSVVFFVRRGARTLYVEIEPDWKGAAGR